MNRLINNPDEVMDEMLEGYLACYPDKFIKLEGFRVLLRRDIEDKVSVVVGAGGGNEPWPSGYVGDGMADGCACGEVFTAPAAKAILNMLREVPNEKGVLCIATNHMGDVLNFELVAELAEMEGIQTRRIYVADDISSAEKNLCYERRGIAGVSFVVKLAAAAAKAGMDLDEVAAFAQKVSDNTFTCSVITSPSYILESGKAAFDLPDGKIEYGMGFNGEMGIERGDIVRADEVVNKVMDMLLADMELEKGDEVVYFLNPFMGTTYLESYIITRKVLEILTGLNIKVYAKHVDTLFSTQGSGGFSISLLRLEENMKPFYNRSINVPTMRNWEKGE